MPIFTNHRRTLFIRIFISGLLLSSCSPQGDIQPDQRKSIHQLQSEEHRDQPEPEVNLVHVRTGLDVLLDDYTNDLRGQTVALVTNQTGIDHDGVPNYTRLMQIQDVNLKVIFSPEHGLFGEAAAGEKVQYQDELKSLPEVISLYGQTRKPTPEMLNGVTLILYDIQDVGARFYTYISTLGLVMEAAAELEIPVWVLDRPNPLRGDRIEGPLLTTEYKSFVGYYPIPIQYGLTVGELAQMIVGEEWINNQPELKVISMDGWSRSVWFDETDLPWIKPSPNIPDLETAIVYPGMCLVEGTNLSEGRGTDHPFKWIGAPWIDAQQWAATLNRQSLPGVVFKPITFTPEDRPGQAMNPKYENERCYGIELVITDRNEFESINTGVFILSTIAKLYPGTFKTRTDWLKKLWGSTTLLETIAKQKPQNFLIEQIEKDVVQFKKDISQYMIYKK